MSVLSEILAHKLTEVDYARRRRPASELEKRIADMPPTRDFIGALRSAERPALIAEVKKASPSKGVIREDFDPVAIARTYADNGAACVSVLTDEPFFQGHLSHLRVVRAVVDRPLLRKDFLIDDYQLLESREAGADAVLFVVAALRRADVEAMVQRTRSLGMEALVEVHNREELEEALGTTARVIGVNNRDLHQFRTTLQTTLDLMPLIPADRLVVSESGVSRRADVERLRDVGVHAVLVGEALMREKDMGAKVRELLGR
ncbi:MAG TPA: indole-3-glycerol phosphate synthase TrpC [Chthonomonadales bacterium]|nr:indole-3-glycerol phosphate synthase TrpC [Chthonomonadales bacterium]